MPRIPVNGVEMNVAVVGKGPAVVAIHGFTGSIGAWDTFVEAARGEFTLVLIDVLGHGASDAPQDPGWYSMSQCCRDLLGVIDSLGFDRPSWVGYSMGGRMCLYLALTAPERCHALVLEGASPGIEDDGERQARAETDSALARMIEEQGVAAFVEYWESLPLFASQKRLPRKVQSALRRQRLSHSPIGLANSLRRMGAGAQAPLHDRLATLGPPALFVAGQGDEKYSRLAQWMATTVPDGRSELVPEAGHCPHLEQPERFNEAVLGFLREHTQADEERQHEEPAYG